MTTPWSRYYYLHFTHKESEAPQIQNNLPEANELEELG